MKKLILLCAAIFSALIDAEAQVPTCGGNVPYFFVDLTGNPAGTWVSPGHSRIGNCCGTLPPDGCTSFEVICDTNAAMIVFDIASGAIPSGSMFYQINCGPQIPVGQPICITGPNPHYITFCKPGNNQNTYSITSIPRPIFPPDDTTRIGCSSPIVLIGMQNNTCTWNSIYPGLPGDYNSYLSCVTSCDTTIYTPDVNAPPYIDYYVCGTPIATPCGFVAACDTIRMYNMQPLTGTTSPNPAGFCLGGPGVTVNASASGGFGPYTFIWRDQSMVQVCSGSSCLLTNAGIYSVEIGDALSDSTYCPGTFISTTVIVTPPPVVDAGSDQTLCPTNPVAILNGSVQNATGGVWSGGAGTFNPGSTSLFTSYTPTTAEITSGSVTLTLTSTGAGGGCDNDSDQVTIYFPAPLVVTVADTSVNCFGDYGSLTAIVSGGVAPYSYQWTTGQISSSISAGQGTYCVSVTDLLGCVTTSCGTVYAPPLLYISMSSTACSTNGGNDGTATTTVTGGTPPYTYLWSTGATTTTITGLSYGIYTVTATDANGCTIYSSVVVNEPRCTGFDATASGTDITCFDGDNGSATATPNSGTAPFTYLWNDPSGQTTSTAINLSGGVYQCVITDAIGCLAVVNISLTQPTALANTMTHTNATTVGGSDGSASANPMGGISPYTYSWSTGATTQSISGLSAGTYSVLITDSNGCTLLDSVMINEPPCANLVAGVAPVNVSCNGGNDGSASAVVILGNDPYTYLWSTGDTTSTITGLAAGSYNVTITDSINCSTFVTFSINEPSPLSIALAPVGISCAGANDGTIELTVNGGTFPYTYLWTNGLPTEDQINLSAGSYTVTVTDANGCQVIGSATITEPNPIVITSITTDVVCFGESTGSINASVSGGVPSYAYSWSNGATTQDISGLATGQYILTLTDGNGCTATHSALIDQPDTLLLLSATADCPVPGSGVALVTMTATGGNSGSYQFSVDGGSTFLPSGVNTIYLPVDSTYTITVRDTFGCPGFNTIILNIAPEPEIVSVIFPPCVPDGADSVNVTLVVTGGNGSMQASFDNGVTWNATGDYSTNLAVGATYIIVVRDSLGCISVSDTITISTDIVVSGVISQYNGNQISCNGAADGWIDITVSGGEGNYTYDWSNGSTTEDITDLGPGTYSVVITDAMGCTDTLIFTLTEPNPLSASIYSLVNFNGYDVSCNGSSDGAINLTVAGGTPGYTFSWSNGATTEDINGLGAGTYSVTITDLNGCTYSTSIILSEPPALTISGTTVDVLCNGPPTGVVDITISGGVGPYSYAWSNGASTEDISLLPAGTYSVVVVDQNSCSITGTFTIIQMAPAVATGIMSDYNGYQVSCSGASDGSIDLTVVGSAGPYTFNWSNGATTEDLSGIPAGSYSVTITDTNGCQLVISFNLASPPPLFGAITSLNDFNGYEISCNGSLDGSIDLSVGGGFPGYSYNWSNGATTEDISNLAAGSYSVIVTDSNGCSITASIVLSSPPALDVNAVVIDVNCNGSSTGEIDITVSGGVSPYTYIWSNGSVAEDINNLFAGMYTVVITDQNGCTLTSSFTITEPTPIVVNSALSDYNGYNISCNGSNDGSVDLSVNGGTPGYTYGWSNGSTNQDLTGVGAGNYSVVITDANGCTSTLSFTLTEPPALGGAIVSVYDFNGFEISCNGGNDGAIDLTVNGGNPAYNYAWSNGATTEDISNLVAGTYSVAVTDQNGCSFTASITLSDPEKFVNSAVVQDISCNGSPTGTIDLSTTGGVYPYTYSWSNGATTQDLTNLNAGTYSVIITDDNGCIITGTFVINELSPVGLDAIQTGPLCADDNSGNIDLTVIGGTAPYNFTWSNGATSEDLVNIGGGTYVVTVTDANNCSTSATFFLVDPLALTSSVSSPVNSAGFNISNYGLSDGSIDLTVEGGVPPYSYQWSNGATTEDLSGVPAGTYSVIITDANGCQSTEVITLTEPFELAMPTGFSPNGDGQNDYFVIHGIEAYPHNSIEIYNRWGNLVWDAVDYQNTWNGTNEIGDELPDATYFVILNINDGAIILKGYVDIRR